MTTSNAIPSAKVKTKSERKFSFVWLVPVLAAIIGGAVAWQTYAEQGPLIEIEFDAGSGIEAGKTQVKYKDIVIGLVEEVGLTEDYQRVIAKARINRELAKFLGDTTEFWIVRARIDGTSISGLSTILSGAFIEMNWAEEASNQLREFKALDRPPLTPPGTPGKRIILVSDRGGSLNVGSPVYFKQLKAGRIESRRLSDDAQEVIFDAFIEAPFHNFIKEGVKFWNVSGIDVTANSDGLKVHMESLETLLGGGVAFESIDKSLSGPVQEEKPRFDLYQSRDDAEESLFIAKDNDRFRFIAEFNGSISGLKPDAPIEWEGIRLGSVIDVVYQPSIDPDIDDRVYAVLQLQPARIGMPDDLSEDEVRESMTALVARGLRVQLAAGNILTGSKKINLVDKPDAPPAEIDFDATPYPSLPTVDSDLEAIAQNVETLIKNLSELPLDDLVITATNLLKDADTLVSNPDLNKVPSELVVSLRSISALTKNLDAASGDFPQLIQELLALSNSAENMLRGFSPDSEMYVELSATVRDLKSASYSLSELMQRLESNPNALIFGR
nr:MlaD family protein [Roseibium hamelinense]